MTRDLAETICELKNAGVKTYAAHLKGKMQYDEPDYTGATAFMIGNEETVCRMKSLILRILILKFQCVDRWNL